MKVVIVDDHPLVEDYLTNIIKENFPEYTVESLPIKQSIAQDIIRSAPDLVMLDISLDRYDSFDFFTDLKSALPKTYFIIHSMHNLRGYITFFEDTGAHAYILKDGHTDKVIRIIKGVQLGKKYFPKPRINKTQRQYSLNQLKFSALEKEFLEALINSHDTEYLVNRLQEDRSSVLELRKKLLFKAGARNSQHLVELTLTYNWHK